MSKHVNIVIQDIHTEDMLHVHTEGMLHVHTESMLHVHTRILVCFKIKTLLY